MLQLFSNRVTRFRHKLTSLDDQPVGKAALTILIFLDLFILVSIFDGLSDHTRQLTGPDEYIPQFCRDIVIGDQWNETERLGALARIVSTATGSYYYPDEREKSREKHPVCEPVAKQLYAIEEDHELASDLNEYLKIEREAKQLDADLERIKSAYDTRLLETMAERDKGLADIQSTRNAIATKTASIDRLVQKEKLLGVSLLQHKQIQDLFAIIDGLTETDRTRLKEDLRSLNFWFPVKRLGMEMLFLLPLFLVFYLWNEASIKRNRPFQVLVSSHLLVVVFIPVLFKIIELIYDIVPKKLLKNIIELLESLNLVALWYYLLMGIIILAAMALIYLFQKKLFSHEKMIEKRISKGLCQHCGRHLPAGVNACPFCGSEQYRLCSHCNKPTYIYGTFCRECGHRDA